ncbi:MAG: MTH1187 family thiamine-binding protein [Gemmatimonadota bacterium]
MHAIVEVQIIPIGTGVSVRKEVMRAHELLESSGLNIALHANGSNMEGELDEVLTAIRNAIETLHVEGVVRLSTHIKIGTRTDKVPSMKGKLFK